MSNYFEYHNAWGASASFYACHKKKKGVPLVIFLPENKSVMESVKNELELFSDLKILDYPSYTQNPFEEARPLTSIMAARSRTLYNILNEKDYILLLSPYSMLKKIPFKNEFLESIISLEKDKEYPMQRLEKELDKLGYIHVEFVTDAGEYTFRGGIADIFPAGYDDPVRIEYFDEEIESIFTYNKDSQARKKEITNLKILPVSDLLITTEEFIEKLEDNDLKEKAENFGKFAGFHWLAPYIHKDQSDIFEYLDNYDTACFMSSMQDSIYGYYDIIESSAQDDIQKESFLSAKEAVEKLSRNNVYIISEITDSVASTPLSFASSKTRFLFEKKNLYQSMTNAAETLLALLKENMKIVFSVESEKFTGIFKDFLRDYDIFPKEIKKLSEIEKPSISLYRKHISGGFIDKESSYAVISDMDIFGFTKRKPKPKKKDAFNTKLSDLEEGDYVVHVNHGIGIYQGIKHMVIAGSEGDFLSIMYEGEDLLYVPLHSIGQLQKYIGMQNQQPKLNSLKSSAWQKLKKHAKESAKHIAEDLLRLYAERKARKGFAFNDDGSLIEIFERNFEYTETEDQLSAIYDVYNDMESETPMERLVCGDVGFGKTEVAMRAACKAIACSKQVAVLVPTTILARQHYETFIERFKGLPVNIEFVSRFRTDKETKSIFNKVSEGSIDILIGTHKILSKDLSFKDLGLLIIDEEQRFGVSHKEKIASIKRNVDTLTLSATPIPRTLQLSLSGIRDMSIIETPPENRLPVVVKVIKGLSERIKAVKSELERGGQVFFLHNRVQDIQEAALEIKRELPLARVDYAHGQMDAKTMEQILSSFYNGEIDVLVATTIIENGINIPNVNTIIINNAAHFGLSQLYQLKGRVGRSARRGYCYLAVDDFARLNDIAQKRLSIIQQLSDLGSGFKIAMYDLQLRGAGNILGAEQSGFVVRVGYELYVAMIEEAVQEMKGEYTNIADTEINSNIAYFIPADYIENPRIRFDFYRRFADIYDMNSMQELLKEIEAGYGELPEEVLNLSLIMLIKNFASMLGAEKLMLSKSGAAKVTFAKETKLNPALIVKCSQDRKILYRFISEYELSLAVDAGEPLKVTAEFFQDLYTLSRAD